jgi:hypothetical protein
MRASILMKAILALGLISAAGCGGGGGGSIALDQVGAKFSEASCAKIFSCCDMAERTTIFANFNPPPTTQAECQNSLGALLGLGISQSQASVQAGREAYDGSAAGSCIDALESTACTALDDTPASCDQMFTGKVAVGGACAENGECTGSAFCKGATNGNVDGMCTALPASGEACPDFHCAKGSYCKDGTCAAPQADGQSCFGDDECQSGHCIANGDAQQCGTEPAMCDGA